MNDLVVTATTERATPITVRAWTSQRRFALHIGDQVDPAVPEVRIVMAENELRRLAGEVVAAVRELDRQRRAPAAKRKGE